MSAAAERSLFATKGRAAPGGTKAPLSPEPAQQPASSAGGEPGPAPGAPRARADAPIQAPLPLLDADREPAPAHPETHPAGSLLTFRLRGGPGKSVLTDEIKSALQNSTVTVADVTESPIEAPAELVAAAIEHPRPAQAAPAAADPAPAALASEAMPPEAARPVPAVAPAGRTADSPSTRLDRPLFPSALPAREEATPVPAFMAPRASAARTVLPAAVAVLAIAAVGWLIADSESPAPSTPPAPEAQIAAADAAPVSEPAAETDAPVAAQDAPALATPVPPAAAVETAPAQPAPAAPEAPSTDATALPAMAEPTADPAAPANVAPAITAAPSAGPSPANPTDGAPTADLPILDVVRVEPESPPVLAGRAAPGSQLIILDNGAPIGTATADANGEWALVSDTPLPAGRHEFSLALKTPEDAIVVEQAEAVAGDSIGSGPEGLLVPPQKPAPGSDGVTTADAAGQAVSPAYVIQLASVPSVADAEREWARLQQAHPAQLGGRTVDVNAAEVGDRGTFYRVRTGPFADRNAARELCRELNAAGQECLVVRESATE